MTKFLRGFGLPNPPTNPNASKKPAAKEASAQNTGTQAAGNTSKTPPTPATQGAGQGKLSDRINQYAARQEALAKENADRIRREANKQAQNTQPPGSTSQLLPGDPKKLPPAQRDKLIAQNNENTRDARVGIRTGDSATLQNPQTMRNNKTPGEDVGEMRMNQAAEESGLKKEMPGGEDAVAELNRRLEEERQNNTRRQAQGLPPVYDPELHQALDRLNQADQNIRKTGDDLNRYLGGSKTPSAGYSEIGAPALSLDPSDKNTLLPLPPNTLPQSERNKPENQGQTRPLTDQEKDELRQALESEQIQDSDQSRYSYKDNPALSGETKKAIGDPTPPAPPIQTQDPFNPKAGKDKLGYVPEGTARDNAIVHEAARQRAEAAQLERDNAQTRDKMGNLIVPKVMGGGDKVNENQKAQTQETQGAVNDLTDHAVKQQNDADAIAALRDSQQFNDQQRQSNEKFKADVQDFQVQEAQIGVDTAVGSIAAGAEGVLTGPGRSIGKQAGKELGKEVGEAAGKQLDEALPPAPRNSDFNLSPPKNWQPDPEDTAELMPAPPREYPRANPGTARPLTPEEIAELPHGMTPEQGSLARRGDSPAPGTTWSETDKRRFMAERFPEDTPQTAPETGPNRTASADPKNNILRSQDDVDGLTMRHEADHLQTHRDAAVYQAWYESLTPEELSKMKPPPEPPPYKVSPDLVDSARRQGLHKDPERVEKGFEASYDLNQTLNPNKKMGTPESFNQYRFSYNELAADMAALQQEIDHATDPAVKAQLQRRYDNLRQIWNDIQSGKIDLKTTNGESKLPPAPAQSPNSTKAP